jgi:hypothetical protein
MARRAVQVESVVEGALAHREALERPRDGGDGRVDGGVGEASRRLEGGATVGGELNGHAQRREEPRVRVGSG